MINTTTIHIRIEHFMKQEGLNISQVSQRAGLNIGTLSGIMNGKRVISVNQLDRITSVLGLPEGQFYEEYIEECLSESQPNWRRIKPFLYRCAELDKLDCIRQTVNHLMNYLVYSSVLFEVAEEFFQRELFDAATIIYESVAASERLQNSERLAVCQYRLFTIRLGSSQTENLLLAHQFEPYVERLDEIDQLDALRVLANTYRALGRWDKVEQLAITMREKGKIQYHLAHHSKKREARKKTFRPLFFYVAYGSHLQANACEALCDFKRAIKFVSEYEELDWVQEKDPDTLHWIELFKEWAKYNILAFKLLSGDLSVLHEYIQYAELKEGEIFPVVFNVVAAANRHNFNVDNIIDRYESYILSYIYSNQSSHTYSKQLLDNSLSDFLHDLASYYLNHKNYSMGFKYILISLEFSSSIDKKSCIIKTIGLFESYRELASHKIKRLYQNLICEVYKVEKEKAGSNFI